MNILCNSKELTNAVVNIQRIVSDRSSLSALNGILISAEGGILHLSAYNMGLSIKTSLKILNSAEGKILLNAKIFSEILKKISSEKIEISANDNLIKIVGGTANFSIAGLDPFEFPKLPSIDENITLSIPCKLLGDMIRQTIFCVSNDQHNPVYTGALFEVEDGFLKIVTIDGFRLAIRQEKINLSDASADIPNFIVPEKSLREILNIISTKDEETVTITVDKKHAKFEIDNYTIISQLLEGKFLNYKETIPTDHSTLLLINTKKLIDTIDRVSLVVTEKSKNPIRCIIKDNKLSLSCITSIGKAYDELATSMEGEELEIGFNSRYILDALKAAETDEVKIELKNNLQPVKIVPKDGDNFIFLVLPVRIDS